MEESHAVDAAVEAAVLHGAAAGDHPEVGAGEAHGGEAHAYVEEHASGGDAHGGGHGDPKVIDLSAEMFLWTLGTFIVMAVVLKKIAWKPILEGLEQRENYLRQSVDNAGKLENELAGIETKRTSVIAEADEKAKDIVSQARRAGLEAERVIQGKAKEEATILLENAQREIAAARDKAHAQLRQESVNSAIDLAGKLIGENLDSDRNRELTNRLIGQIES